MQMEKLPYIYYYNKYIDKITKHRNGEELLKDSELFQLLAAVKLKMITNKDALINNISLVSHDITRIAQIKIKKNVNISDLYETIVECLKLDVHHRTLVCFDKTQVDDDTKLLFKIVNISLDEPLPEHDIIVNEFVRLGLLDFNDKLNELIKQFNEKGKPQTSSKFTDGSNMYGFWSKIKYGRKLNNLDHDRLRLCKPLMKVYVKENKDDFDKRINSFIKHSNENTYTKFSTWNDILDGKLDINWNDFPQYMKNSYESHIQHCRPDEYKLLRTVKSYIRFLSEYDDPSTIQFWSDCKKNRLCDKWPYNILLSVDKLKKEYN
jgi:hypothetical protein